MNPTVFMRCFFPLSREKKNNNILILFLHETNAVLMTTQTVLIYDPINIVLIQFWGEYP